MSNTIAIGGRSFRRIEHPTLRLDIYGATLAARGGLVGVQAERGESEGDLCWRIAAGANEAGVLFELLGCTLIADELRDDQWTEEVARETAAYLAELSDPAEKSKIHLQIGALLYPFFRDAIARLQTSPSSSGPVASSPASPVPIAAPPGTVNGAS